MLLDINMRKLSTLVESFYKLTKIKVAIYDASFSLIFTYPTVDSPFCKMMNKNPDVHKNCQKSVREHCELCRAEKRMVTSTCHAGLVEAVTPLYENNILIGYLMFGQITNVKNKSDFMGKVRELCSSYPLDRKEFDRKLLTVPYKNNEQLIAASEIINALTAYIYLEHIVTLKKEETLSAVIEYIDSNLSSDLSTHTLCEHFYVSKTVLYEITKPVMQDGIAKYVRNKRMSKAKELIVNTDASIEEISGMVGFLDANYFRRLFKQLYGMSAAAYRKRHKVNPF